MFNRTAQVLLRQKYEAETESIRGDYEAVKNGLVASRQETDELRAERNRLIDENRKLIESSSKLKIEIDGQNSKIDSNKALLDEMNTESVSLNSKNQLLRSEIDKLAKDKARKLLELKDVEASLVNVQDNISKSLTFLDKVNVKVDDKKLEINALDKQISNKMIALESKERSLQEFENKLIQKDLDNVQESNRLDKYKERLNKYYEEFGINIKL